MVVPAGLGVAVGLVGAGVPAGLGVAVGVVGPELVSAGDVAAPGVDGPELALVGAIAELADVAGIATAVADPRRGLASGRLAWLNQRPLTRLSLCGPPQAAYRLPHLGEV